VVVLGAALCNAFYQMLTSKVAGDGTNTSLFYSTVVGAVVLTLALPWGFAETTLSSRDWLLLVAAGLFAAAGHGLMIHAFQLAPPSLLAPFTYVQMVWAVAFGYAAFGQLPDRWSALGMAIIVGSGVLLAVLERRRARLGRSFP
jgi:drug/metabolite transporter (DMT)-like permease